MLFHRNRTFGFANGFQDGVCIQWLNGMNVHYFNADAFFFQDLTGFNGFPNHMTAGKDGYIGSFTEELCFSYFEWQVTGKNGPYGTTKTQVNRTLIISYSHGGCR